MVRCGGEERTCLRSTAENQLIKEKYKQINVRPLSPRASLYDTEHYTCTLQRLPLIISVVLSEYSVSVITNLFLP